MDKPLYLILIDDVVEATDRDSLWNAQARQGRGFPAP